MLWPSGNNDGNKNSSNDGGKNDDIKKGNDDSNNYGNNNGKNDGIKNSNNDGNNGGNNDGNNDGKQGAAAVGRWPLPSLDLPADFCFGDGDHDDDHEGNIISDATTFGLIIIQIHIFIMQSALQTKNWF